MSSSEIIARIHEMNIQIDISQSMREQVERGFKLSDIDGSLHLDPAVGAGGAVRHLVFPGRTSSIL
jgi:hypothetical protein